MKKVKSEKKSKHDKALCMCCGKVCHANQKVLLCKGLLFPYGDKTLRVPCIGGTPSESLSGTVVSAVLLLLR